MLSAGPLKSISSQIEHIKNALSEVINDPSLNVKGRYDEYIIQGEDLKSFARVVWNLIRHLEKFQANMHKASYPTLAKAGWIAWKAEEMFAKLNYEFNYCFAKKSIIPTLKNISEIKYKLAFIYVSNKAEESLYFIDKNKQKIEKIAINCKKLPELLNYDDIYIKVNEFYPLTNVDIENINKESGREFPLGVFISKEWYIIYKACYEALNELYNKDTHRYNADILIPIISEFRKALPIDWLLSFLSKFIALSKDFSIDGYLDVEIEIELPVIEYKKDVWIYCSDNHFLNQHALFTNEWLQSVLLECEKKFPELLNQSKKPAISIYNEKNNGDEGQELRQKQVDGWVEDLAEYLDQRQKSNKYKAADFFKGKNNDGVKRKTYIDNELAPAFQKYVKNGDVTPVLEALVKGEQFKSAATSSNSRKSLQDVLQEIKNSLLTKKKLEK